MFLYNQNQKAKGYPYGIPYRVIYSTGNLGIQMIVTPQPPPPSH